MYELRISDISDWVAKEEQQERKQCFSHNSIMGYDIPRKHVKGTSFCVAIGATSFPKFRLDIWQVMQYEMW